MSFWQNISTYFSSEYYTFWVVSIGAGIICFAAGIVGTFSYLRKRALIGDVVSHAVLPGVAISFMLTGVKNPLYFLIGATTSGILSIWLVDFIQSKSKLKPDTILALTLSVFFGIGIVLLTKIQHSGDAAQSGLDSFLFGKAASMTMHDVIIFSIIALINTICIVIFLRAFSIISFDEEYAKSIGFNVKVIKSFLALLTVITVAIGIQSVGIVLMAALLITPASGARFLTNSVKKMLVYAGIFALFSGFSGVIISSSGKAMPTGPWIVVVLSIFTIIAIFFGKEKGVIARMRTRKSNNIKINNENTLKTIYKLSKEGNDSIPLDQLINNQSTTQFKPILKRLEKNQILIRVNESVILTEKGKLAAREVIRKHRLWEIYLSKYFNLDPDHLHDDAEGIEHIITPEIEKHLITLLNRPEKDPHQSEIPY
jgi:manganese/zinc/iron transport system permease protein